MAQSVEVLDPGILSTVQDLGRRGYQHLGFSVGGASDPRALILANHLVGNPVSSAGVEMTARGPRLRFSEVTAVAVVGIDPVVLLDGVAADSAKTLLVGPGSELAIPSMAGARSYLAIHGGIDVPLVMGSRSTDLLAGFGGLDGRRLERGDRLPTLGGAAIPGRRRLTPQFELRQGDRVRVRFCADPRYPQLQGALAQFIAQGWEVGPELDRVGLRLVGKEILGSRDQVLSEGQPAGAIQLPGSGLPIVLLSARHTVGGYPKLGVVGPMGICTLAQATPGTKVAFELVESDQLAREARGWLAALEWPEVCTDGVL